MGSRRNGSQFLSIQHTTLGRLAQAHISPWFAATSHMLMRCGRCEQGFHCTNLFVLNIRMCEIGTKRPTPFSPQIASQAIKQINVRPKTSRP